MEPITKDEFYCRVLEAATLRSNCDMKIGGAVLVKDNFIVSVGHGGVMGSRRSCDEVGHLHQATRKLVPDPGGMGGKELIKELLGIDPKIRVIVSSGYSNDPIMSDFVKYGFKGCIAKPYKIGDLSETLHKVLNEI